MTAEVVCALGALDLNGGSAVDAPGRWVDASWTMLGRYPVLLTPAIAPPEGNDESERHKPHMSGLLQVIKRGAGGGNSTGRCRSPGYLAAIIGLGHAVG